MITFAFRMKLFPKCFEPLWLVWLCGEVVSIVDTDLHHGRHVLEGSEGHDGAQYWVSSEENKLRVGCEAVVDFVPKSCIVPEIFIIDIIIILKYFLLLVHIITHLRRNINTEIIIIISNIKSYVVHVPHMFFFIR